MTLLIAVAAIAILLIVVLSASVRVAREYERGVIFRLGRLLSPPKGPGLFLLIPVIDKMVRVDLRTVTLNVPPQEVITKDNVPVRVNAVAYFRIIDPEKAIVQVENFMVATSQISQTTLRSVLGQHQLDELLSERDKINEILQRIIDEATSPWGVKVSIVEVKDVEIPSGMQRAMARQAEAERERRAKVIAAEGEFQASERLKDAAEVLAQNPMSLQLRYLQTMLEMSSERTSTLILPLPMDLIGPMVDRSATRTAAEQRLRRDPLSGRTVVIAPGRARRPGAFLGAIEDADCGGAATRARSAPGARTARRRRRCVLPEGGALDRARGSEPVPRARAPGGSRPLAAPRSHVRGARGRRARPRRRGVAPAVRGGAEDGFPYVHAMINEGRFAGASLAHSHSQLVWLREPPPAVAREATADCAVCGLVASERSGGRRRGEIWPRSATQPAARRSSC